MMDWLWAVWFIVSGVLFISFETYALLHPDQMHTLSYWLWFIATRHPLPFVLPSAGIIIGLSIHFWNYTP